MYRINPLLESDFYKQVHWNQYPEGITKIVSYFTPRMCRLNTTDHIVMFGLQSFIKEYLIEDFNEYFFNRSKEEIITEYKHLMDNTLGEGLYGIERIERLHDLGYLPLEIKALPEGARVPVGVPMFEISNTHPNFAWLTNAIESVISCEMWHGMISATVGTIYRDIVDRFYEETVDKTQGTVNKTQNPQTGDNIIIFSVILAIAVVGLTVSIIITKKKSKNNK